MTGDRLLLDTNAVISIFAGNPSVKHWLADASEIYLPVIVLGELYYGVSKSARRQDNLAKVEAIAAELTVLECDVDTARRYGVIKEDLRAKGRPIPENDIWIGALAIQYGLAVATSDAHFRQISGLKILPVSRPG